MYSIEELLEQEAVKILSIGAPKIIIEDWMIANKKT